MYHWELNKGLKGIGILGFVGLAGLAGEWIEPFLVLNFKKWLKMCETFKKNLCYIEKEWFEDKNGKGG